LTRRSQRAILKSDLPKVNATGGPVKERAVHLEGARENMHTNVTSSLTIALLLAAGGVSPAPAAVEGQPQQQSPFDPEKLPDVVARVNGEELSKVDLLKRARALQARNRGAGEDQQFYRVVLDQMVGTRLLFSESESHGLLATDAEVDAQLANLRGRFPDEPAFHKALNDQGFSVEGLKREVRENLSIQKLIEKEIVSQIRISDEAQQQFYEENRGRMRQPERIRVSHILLRVEKGDSPEVKAEKLKKAESLRTRIQSGEDFAKVAGESSEDPGSKAKGGELPWISPGDTVPPFEKAAFGLEAGGLSGVVESQYGFHLIKLHEKQAASTIPFESAKTRIIEFLTQREVQQRIEDRVNQLRGKAKVEILI
jgi:peptidyl-prolyl cis-trans isomerase C